ncbi:site-specific integrase [Burkholderia sp. Ac-20365]|uniref:tyrosine-type recombinase/integrase n=1 Tax=Burkholderia sp. Ac-20365 TaxID=2703897 RepID=UPI00197BE2D3|nr:site-specific integrase [Burkholderia sp. Ac-20365]MBN3763411.1 site-specific integrase [Burkholderia sp. Ac-20365]
MATIQTRTNGDGSTVYRALIRRKGHYASGTFDTREQADNWADAMEQRIAESLSIAPGQITLASTVAQMLMKYVKEVTPTKCGEKTERYALNMYIERFRALDKTLANFGTRDLEAIMHARLKGNADYPPVNPATVRREFGMLSGAFTHAMKKWHLPLSVNPCSRIDRPRANPHRTRRVPDRERDAVCQSLGWDQRTKPTTRPQRVAWAFCFALETAMRRGEILRADWSQYDERARRLHVPFSKNGDARNVPISARARALLDLMGVRQSGSIVNVIETTFANAWNAAKKGKAWEDLHFHDARHEATTRFAKLVPTVLHLQKITGHRDLKSLLIYFNPEADELAGLLDGPALKLAA